MDKLPRLMQAGLPQSIDPVHFADTRESISGEISIKGMQRVKHQLSDSEALISFSLGFERDEKRRVTILGGFHCRLQMLCQRCLQPVQVTVEHEIATVLISDEAEAANLPRNREGYLLSDKRLSLEDLLEEELLLALPLAPAHEDANCEYVDSEETGEQDERQYPFKVLAEMKTKLSKD